MFFQTEKFAEIFRFESKNFNEFFGLETFVPKAEVVWDASIPNRFAMSIAVSYLIKTTSPFSSVKLPSINCRRA